MNTPVLPAPPGVTRQRTRTTNNTPGTPGPGRIPIAPKSEPVGNLGLKRSGNQAKQGGDLISTADSWEMTREREQRLREEIEAKVRAEMEEEERLRMTIEMEVRRQAEEQRKREEEQLRQEMEARIRREVEMQVLREMSVTMPVASPRVQAQPVAAPARARAPSGGGNQSPRGGGGGGGNQSPRGGGGGGGNQSPRGNTGGNVVKVANPTPQSTPKMVRPPGTVPHKGHLRKGSSVTNSAAELRVALSSSPAAPQLRSSVTGPIQRSSSAANVPPLKRRPVPPPPPNAPKPLSPRTVAAIQIQAMVRRFLAKRRLKRLRRRVIAVKEILTTEEQYVTKLKAFETIFFTAVRDAESQSLINPSDVAAIVGNWDDVLTYNTELLRQLRARCANFRAAHTVGDILLGMRHFSPIYSAFLTGYDNSLGVVMWHQKNNPPMAKIIKACEKQLGNTIESYLILPVQRIPRYVLLLKAVMHETDKMHPDYALCDQAAQKMEHVGTQVNERRREYEAEEQRQATLRELTSQIAGLKQGLLDDNRRLLRPVTDIVLFDSSEGGKRTRAYALLSDVFLLLEHFKSPGLTKAQRAIRYKLVVSVTLKDSHMTDITDGSGYLGVTAWNSFLLHHAAGSLYLFTKTPEEKKELMAQIEQAIIHSRGIQ